MTDYKIFKPFRNLLFFKKNQKEDVMNAIVETLYKDHQVKPLISPERDLDAWLLHPKPVPKRNIKDFKNEIY